MPLSRLLLLLLCLVACGGSSPGVAPAAHVETTEGRGETTASSSPADSMISDLDWAEGTEEVAITAARELGRAELTDSQRSDASRALDRAYARVEGARGVDNRMRIEFVRTMGALRHADALPGLMRIASTIDENQNFLINRLALEKLAPYREETTIPVMIEALFLFDPDNPAMRMNDVAADGLILQGAVAYEPLRELFAGRNSRANQIVTDYVAAIQARDAGEGMTVEGLVEAEALVVIGGLGLPDSVDFLLSLAERGDIERRLNAAFAVVRARPSPADLPRARRALISVFEASNDGMRPAVLMAMGLLYDEELLPFLLRQVRRRDVHPLVRLEVVKSYALLANAAESAALRRTVRAMSRDDRDGAAPVLVLLEGVATCDEDLACWVERMSSEEEEGALKACAMVGRYGAANPDAIAALTDALGHRTLSVRVAAVFAIDHVAVEGSEAAARRIETLREQEEGRSIWHNFSREAQPIRARLISRALR